LILSFADEETKDIFDGTKSRKALRRLAPVLWHIAQRKMHMIQAAARLDDLRVPPANRLEALKDELKGLHSIRINDQYRIVFRWIDQNAEAVKIVDYH